MQLVVRNVRRRRAIWPLRWSCFWHSSSPVLAARCTTHSASRTWMITSKSQRHRHWSVFRTFFGCLALRSDTHSPLTS
uniref:Putative secreted protein n=1 Tax=Anopheles darlingi TaxID=43151 RepID=A0A2M4DER0_ANODA